MQQAGTSNKSWGLSGINYISLPEGIRGMAKGSGTDQHGLPLRTRKRQKKLIFFSFHWYVGYCGSKIASQPQGWVMGSRYPLTNEDTHAWSLKSLYFSYAKISSWKPTSSSASYWPQGVLNNLQRDYRRVRWLLLLFMEQGLERETAGSSDSERCDFCHPSTSSQFSWPSKTLSDLKTLPLSDEATERNVGTRQEIVRDLWSGITRYVLNAYLCSFCSEGRVKIFFCNTFRLKVSRQTINLLDLGFHS